MHGTAPPAPAGAEQKPALWGRQAGVNKPGHTKHHYSQEPKGSNGPSDRRENGGTERGLKKEGRSDTGYDAGDPRGHSVSETGRNAQTRAVGFRLREVPGGVEFAEPGGGRAGAGGWGRGGAVRGGRCQPGKTEKLRR